MSFNCRYWDSIALPLLSEHQHFGGMFCFRVHGLGEYDGDVGLYGHVVRTVAGKAKGNGRRHKRGRRQWE